MSLAQDEGDSSKLASELYKDVWIVWIESMHSTMKVQSNYHWRRKVASKASYDISSQALNMIKLSRV